MTNQKMEKIPFSLELVTYSYTAIYELHSYKHFYFDVENLIEKGEKALQADISKDLEDVPKENYGDVIESYGYDLQHYQSIFPSMHREATFITLYNFLEHHLNQFCRKLGDEMKSSIRLGHLKGNGVERSLIFLKKIPKFKFEKINDEISFIKNANTLRNFVVHSGGVLPEDERHKVNSFVESQGFLAGSPGQTVTIRSKFISSFMDVIESFFVNMENETQQFLERNRT